MNYRYAFIMFFSYSPIEGMILEILNEGPILLPLLSKRVSEQRGPTTRQALYQALKYLKQKEVIVVTQKEVSLSSIWLNRLSDFTQEALVRHKMNDQPSINFLRLEEGERISYSFKTFETTDIFWGHAFQVLADNMPASVPMIAYIPHYWFFFARPESEIFLFNKLKENNKQIYVIAGDRTKLDIETQKFFDNVFSYYYASPQPLFKKHNYYVSIFNDFQIEVWLDPDVSELIDQFYKSCDELTEIKKSELLDIIKQPGKNKLVISKNSRKIHSARNLFKKTFGLNDAIFGS